MRLCVWSPLPPSSSGIADYVAEQLAELTRHAYVTAVVEDPSTVEPLAADGLRLARPDDVGEADLDLYHVGNSPPHAYVYRAALRRPGVVVLHDLCLHHLVLRETVERGDRTAYLREMRRDYGEVGTFVGRQVARALGGEYLPALFPLNQRLLERSLAVVGLTAQIVDGARRRLAARPVFQLPHHLALPIDSVPSREEARAALGLPADALLVTAPGLATTSKRLDVAIRAVAVLRERFPNLRLVVAGAIDGDLPLSAWAQQAGLGDALLVTGRVAIGDFVRHLAAADVVLSLRFPSRGEMSGALLRSLGVGRPVLVTAGSAAAEEFPEGVVVPVDTGPREEAVLTALLDRLLADAGLRQTIGRLAREYVLRHHGLVETTMRLAKFLQDVAAQREKLIRVVAARRLSEDGLTGFFLDEARRAALDLGLDGLPTDVIPILTTLPGASR